jgi:branched-chain amino acid transport system ATP-binding protein
MTFIGANTSDRGLKVTALHASYGRLEVLRDVAFEAGNGGILGILGPNGAGKSTLLGALAGIVSSRGTIEVAGRQVGQMTARMRARAGIAFVPEGRRNLFGPMTVAENLELGLRLIPLAARKVVLERLHALFPVLALRRNQTASMLSGGEQQMLAIAIALARQPAALLLDEPTQGLAPVALDVLAETIRALRHEGITIVMAEQNIHFSRSVADQFLIMRDGLFVYAGTRDILADPRALAALSLAGTEGDIPRRLN